MRIRLILLSFVVIAAAAYVTVYPYYLDVKQAYWPAEPAKPASLAGLDKTIDPAAPVFLRIFKQESQLEVWAQRGERYTLVKTYPICKWSGELGPKLKEGDRQSPEGFYHDEGISKYAWEVS